MDAKQAARRYLTLLLSAYRKLPSGNKRAKLQGYLDRSGPEAARLLSQDEIAFLRAHEFRV